MAEQQDLAGIIKGIQTDVRSIVRGEIELVKAELIPQAKAAGIGAGLLGGAAYLAITAGMLLFFGLSFLLSLGFMTWFSLSALGALAWGFSVMAVLLLLIAGGLAFVARQQMNFSAPKAAIEQAEKTGDTVTRAVKSSLRQAGSLSLTGAPRQPELE